jgi:hypothetical protein
MIDEFDKKMMAEYEKDHIENMAELENEQKKWIQYLKNKMKQQNQ